MIHKVVVVEKSTGDELVETKFNSEERESITSANEKLAQYGVYVYRGSVLMLCDKETFVTYPMRNRITHTIYR